MCKQVSKTACSESCGAGWQTIAYDCQGGIHGKGKYTCTSPCNEQDCDNCKIIILLAERLPILFVYAYQLPNIFLPSHNDLFCFSLIFSACKSLRKNNKCFRLTFGTCSRTCGVGSYTSRYMCNGKTHTCEEPCCCGVCGTSKYNQCQAQFID